ncbi:MAG: hypothetical protein AAFO79_12400, partial [Pseudomonadota bacterium]
MLVITGVNPTATWGAGEGRLHELPDQTAFAATVAQATYTVARAGELGTVFEAAWSRMVSARPGPVHLQIPTDVMGERLAAPPVALSGRFYPPETAHRETSLSNGAVTAALAACDAVYAPLIIAGGGAQRASDALIAVAERLEAPVITTTNGRGLLHGHALNVPASPSLVSVRSAINDADLVLAVGTEWGQTDFDVYETGAVFAPKKLIRVDVDAAQLRTGPPSTLAVHADAGVFLEA